MCENIIIIINIINDNIIIINDNINNINDINVCVLMNKVLMNIIIIDNINVCVKW